MANPKHGFSSENPQPKYYITPNDNLDQDEDCQLINLQQPDLPASYQELPALGYFKMHLFFYTLAILGIANLTLVLCLYEDQVGKFDWRRQFIGQPNLVYHHPNSGSIIVGTTKNVVGALSVRDGSILWRQILPKDCGLTHMSILTSNENHEEFLVKTVCQQDRGPITHYWNPQNGLLAADSRLKELQEDHQVVDTLEAAQDGTRLIFKLTSQLYFSIYEDGVISLHDKDRPNQPIWSRDESLASIVAVEFVPLPKQLTDKFGLKKVIVMLTECGKIFGMDTFTGEPLWKLYDKDFAIQKGQSVALVTIKQTDDEDRGSEALIAHSVGRLLLIDPIRGQVIEKTGLPNPIKQISQTEQVEHGSGLIILDVKNLVHIYPNHLTNHVRDNIDNYYLTTVEQSPSRIDGYKLELKSGLIQPVLVWSFPVNDKEELIDLKMKSIKEKVHSPARVLGDRGILYKYVNPNLMAIMTQGNLGEKCNPDYYINIFLVDAVTGSMIFSSTHPKSRGPSNMVHSENWLIYSHYNTKTRRTEVSSLEMFEGIAQINSTAFSSLVRSPVKPKLVEHRSFIFPGGIDAMVETTTLRGMTNKHIIAALPSGALLEIPKIFLDPRRPNNMLMEHREEGLIPYMPELPLPSESIINYNQTLMGVNKIVTTPAKLESTSLVFAYGLDMFFTRVTPSKTFDILKDDFDHVLISVVLVFLVVASYVSKLLAQRKALFAAWK